jgi:hypothetical protein
MARASSTCASTSSYAALCEAAARSGLACRGGLHPVDGDDVPPFGGGVPARTLVLLGFTGSVQWPVFRASPESGDGAPHPLDRWSRRVIDALAMRFGAQAHYPSPGPPWLPFQRWARRAEALHESPLGILLHRDYGLWHAYRGALAFGDWFAVPAPEAWPHPCEACTGKPCLVTCPVGAVQAGSFNATRCATHAAAPEGAACRDGGCLARRACPLGAAHRYDEDQAAFHMRAFLGET